MRCGSFYSTITYIYPTATDFSRSGLFFYRILFLIWSSFSIVVFEWKLKIRRGNPALESVQIIFGYSHTQSNLYYALAANKVCSLFFFFLSPLFFSSILNFRSWNSTKCLIVYISFGCSTILPNHPNSLIAKSLQSKYIYFFVWLAGRHILKIENLLLSKWYASYVYCIQWTIKQLKNKFNINIYNLRSSKYYNFFAIANFYKNIYGNLWIFFFALSVWSSILYNTRLSPFYFKFFLLFLRFGAWCE